MTFPAPVWAVPGLLPSGLGLLGGRPKIGKSWLAMNIACAVAAGGKALGTIDVEQGRVLYLAMEDTPMRLQGRMVAFYPDGGRWPELLRFKTDWPRGSAGIDRLDKWLSRYDDTRIVVGDTLGKLRAPAKRNAGYQDDYDEITQYKALADRYGVCIFLVTHLRKASADDPFDEISGTAGIFGAVDAALLLKRARGDKNGVLHATGRDFDEVELGLSWRDKVWRIEGTAADVQLSAERREIIDLLQDHPEGLKAKAIADTLKKNFGAVRFLLVQLVESGLVCQGEGKLYKTTNIANVTNIANIANIANTQAENVCNVSSARDVSSVSDVSDFVQRGERIGAKTGYHYQPGFAVPDYDLPDRDSRERS